MSSDELGKILVVFNITNGYVQAAPYLDINMPVLRPDHTVRTTLDTRLGTGRDAIIQNTETCQLRPDPFRLAWTRSSIHLIVPSMLKYAVIDQTLRRTDGSKPSTNAQLSAFASLWTAAPSFTTVLT